MPQLLGARFESVGHRDARLDGVRLDFTRAGSPCDSVLWLRNGGGKSSILNLLFSVLRPSQREFLGSEAEARVRALDDYVHADDVSTIALSFALDASGDADREEAIVGQCLERVGTSLERLYFSVRATAPASSPFSLEDLPLSTRDGATTRRLRPRAVRDALIELAKVRTDLRVQVTTVQREWHGVLDALGIDPELFGYQLKMNRREGAADELFRFGSSQEFVNFLLEIAFDPRGAEAVAKNLTTLREKIHRRPRLLAERDALTSAAALLGPAVELARRSSAALDELLAAADATTLLHARVDATREREGARSLQASALAAQDLARAEAARARSRDEGWRRTVLEGRKAALASEAATLASRAISDEVRQIERECALLGLAEKLATVQRLEASARARRSELDARLVEHAPLIERLAAARGVLGRSLDAEMSLTESRRALLTSGLDRWRTSRSDAARIHESALRAQAESNATWTALSAEASRLRDARTRLETDGALLVAEPLVDAEARFGAELVDLANATHSAQLEDQALVERAALGGRRARTLAEERAKATSTRDALDGERASALAERDAIEGDPTLREVLEDSTPSLEAMAEAALARVSARCDTLGHQLVTLRVEERSNARVHESLERRSLLPPSIDAERVHDRLRVQGIDAHFGGAWLAENAKKAAKSDACVARHPELVAGLVVRDEDLSRVQALLSAPDTEATPPVLDLLDAPVVIGTGRQMLEDGAARVVAMPSRALYDRSAAIAERERRREDASRLGARIDQTRTDERRCAALRERMSAFCRAHPRGWFDERARAIEAIEARIDGLVEEEAHVDADLAACRARVAVLRDEAGVRDERRRRSDSHRARIVAFRAHGGDRLAMISGELSAAKAAIDARTLDVSAAVNALVELDQRGEQLKDEQRELTALARSLSSERAKLGPVEAARDALEDVVPIAGLPLEAARARYADASRLYERATGGEALRGAIEADEAQAATERSRWSNEARGHRLDEAEVREALAGAEATLGVGDALERAEIQRRDANSALIERKVEAQSAKRELERATALVDALRAEGGDRIDVMIGTSASIDARSIEAAISSSVRAAQAAVVEAEGALATANDQRLRAERASRGEQAALGAAASLRHVLDDLAPADANEERSDADARLVAILTRARDTADPFEAIDGLAAFVEAEIVRTRAARRAREQCLRESIELAQRIATHASGPDGEPLPAQLRDRLRVDAPATLLGRAADYLHDVTLRGAMIDHELQTIEHDRAMLATSLQRATDPAIHLLRRLQDASVFPESVAGWGGEPFLKVALVLPDAAADREARALEVVDRVVEAGLVPSGLQLVQRLLHELTRGHRLEVRLLKPEAHRRVHYETIDRLRSFSRGEQLTAAILLYCTLAHLRALGRGRRRATTSVLILDNPIGTCSGPSLIDLQRAMAAAHGVQLVYTTGIDDLEAISRMPRVIRLRNEHQDTRGRRRVTAETEHGTHLEAVSIAHRTLT